MSNLFENLFVCLSVIGRSGVKVVIDLNDSESTLRKVIDGKALRVNKDSEGYIIKKTGHEEIDNYLDKSYKVQVIENKFSNLVITKNTKNTKNKDLDDVFYVYNKEGKLEKIIELNPSKLSNKEIEAIENSILGKSLKNGDDIYEMAISAGNKLGGLMKFNTTKEEY